MNIVELLKKQDRAAFFKPETSKHFKKSRRPNSRKGLDPYTGPWNRKANIHLLNRCLFGYNKATLEEFMQKDPNQSLTDILEFTSNMVVPVNDYYGYVEYLNSLPPYQGPNRVEMMTNPGEPWVDQPRSQGSGGNGLTSARSGSLSAWWLKSILFQDSTIEEKMLFFWHNLLVTEQGGVFAPAFTYQYLQTLRGGSLGNFRNLITEITKNGAMLLYLNGYLNGKSAPDENYARELQELFTVGKGENSAYTEEDVSEAARILTGWKINYFEFDVFFAPWDHDTGDKQFSSFYGNRTIQGGSTQADAERELDELIDMILSTDECAKYLCRRLYQFFVYPIVDSWTEDNIISALANTLRSNNYEIKPVMYELLGSQHFFDEINHGALVKSPLDMFASLVKNTGLDLEQYNFAPGDKRNFDTFISLYYQVAGQGQQLGNPPSVAGWPPYYQAPNYDYLWISSTTVKARSQMTDGYSYWGLWRVEYPLSPDTQPIFSDFLSLLTNYINDPGDPNALISELMDNFLIYAENRQEKLDYLKAILLTGTSDDSYWTNSWSNYENDPGNQVFRDEVNWRLRAMFQRFFQLPDFQLQ